MASKKGVGSTKNGRDSNPKYLGVKKFAGEEVLSGNIIVRQRGSRFHAGKNTLVGKDYTIFATVNGKVNFSESKGRRIISVIPS